MAAAGKPAGDNATRVSTGDECSIIIEDGYSKPNEPEVPAPSWKAGEF